jgi:hypothetical protein
MRVVGTVGESPCAQWRQAGLAAEDGASLACALRGRWCGRSGVAPNRAPLRRRADAPSVAWRRVDREARRASLEPLANPPAPNGGKHGLPRGKAQAWLAHSKDAPAGAPPTTPLVRHLQPRWCGRSGVAPDRAPLRRRADAPSVAWRRVDREARRASLEPLANPPRPMAASTACRGRRRKHGLRTPRTPPLVRHLQPRWCATYNPLVRHLHTPLVRTLRRRT